MHLTTEELRLILETLDFQAIVNAEQAQKWNWPEVQAKAEAQAALVARLKSLLSTAREDETFLVVRS